MLLPSDIARLVLGYLDQEGLHATSQAFIIESPNLKEYADHSSDDGAVCTCVLSLFGKHLTTILREYVMAKATEPSQETQVPATMISLWKRCLQNSPALRQGLRCYEELSSRRESESRTVKTRNVPEPKSTKSRKMAHPLPRALRAPYAPPLPPSRLVTNRQSDASVPSEPHTSADEPRPPESPATPLPQSHVQQGLRTSQGLKATSPTGASGKWSAVPPSGSALETSRTRSYSTCYPTLPAPARQPSQPREAVLRLPPTPVGNAPPCGIVAPPAAEGGPSEAKPLATIAAAASSTSSCPPGGESDPDKVISVAIVVGGIEHSDHARSQAVSSFTGGRNPTLALMPLVKPPTEDQPTKTAVDTAEATVVETAEATVVETAEATVVETAEATVVDTAEATVVETAEATVVETAEATVVETAEATVVDTAEATVVETAEATVVETAEATVVETAEATVVETAEATVVDTAEATVVETAEATVVDTAEATVVETAEATVVETAVETAEATVVETAEATAESLSCSQSTEALRAAEHSLLTGKARPAAIRATVTNEEDNVMTCPHGDGEFGQETETGSARSLPVDTSSFIMSDLVTASQRFEATVLPESAPPGQESSPSLMLGTPPLSRPVDAIAMDVSPLPDLTESIMVPPSVTGQNDILTSPGSSVKKQEESKPRANPAQNHSTNAGKMGTLVPVGTPQSVALEKDGTRVGPPSVTSPQSHRRMLCFKVSGRNATGTTTAQLNQRSGAATFRWINPPVLESSRVVGYKTTPEGAKGANAGDEAGTTLGEEPLSSDRKCCRSRADSDQRPTPQSMNLVKGGARLGNCEKLQIVCRKEEIECGGGTNQGVRSKVRKERNGKMPAKDREGWTEEPSHVAADKENKLEGRGWVKPRPVKTIATSPGESALTSVRTPAVPSPSRPGQIPAFKTSALIGQGADMPLGIREQSPAPTLSESPPFPRIPTRGRDLKEVSDRQGTPTRLQGRDREATPQHLPWDPTLDALVPTCSPAANTAACTLMILSSAAISPLRDSGQHGIPPASQGRKHKQDKLLASTDSLDELQLSANRMKAKRQKKLLDSVPDDLDVDKFLSSLHYDE